MVGKEIKGRKRPIVTNILGFILAVAVHAANIHDTSAGCLPAGKALDKYLTIKAFCGDDGYCGSFVEYVVWDFDDVRMEISKRITPKFEVLPKRWRVERSIAWWGNSRRLSKDYEISTVSSENIVIISILYTI